MRIGIVTLYSAYNYGAYLQAYAMQKALKGMGHTPYFVKMESTYRCMRKGLWGTRSLKDAVFNIHKIISFSRAWAELKKGDFKDNDVLLMGSDEIWNIKSKGFKQHPYYFGRGLNAQRKIAYAPSIGFTSPTELAEDTESAESIRSMDTILVRDESTKEAVTQITGQVPDTVLDPTLLIDWNVGERKKKGYLVFYSYNNDPELVGQIKEFARKKGLKIISPCFKRDWCKSVACTPKGFVKLLGEADYVVTSTFHGTIFSIINHARLLVKPSGQKVVDVLNKFGLCDRIFDTKEGQERFEEILNTDVDYSEVDRRIEEARTQSIDSLKKALIK